jgi:hypothetical protein
MVTVVSPPATTQQGLVIGRDRDRMLLASAPIAAPAWRASVVNGGIRRTLHPAERAVEVIAARARALLPTISC